MRCGGVKRQPSGAAALVGRGWGRITILDGAAGQLATEGHICSSQGYGHVSGGVQLVMVSEGSRPGWDSSYEAVDPEHGGAEAGNLGSKIEGQQQCPPSHPGASRTVDVDV
ncbi:hypothetical protein G7046_g7731 [Stylonectria norvegica]|nr:hypothetical protein G7046_g7731 [Stylonectria norvegica]